MSRMTKEINKITGAIIGISGKLIVYALVVLLLFEGVTKGYAFGHEIFYSTAVDAAPGKPKTVVISEDESTSEIAKKMYKQGVIQNPYAFMIQKQFYDYEIHPGTYDLNTSMTSKEILRLMNEEPQETVEETEGPEAAAPETVEEMPEGDYEGIEGEENGETIE